MRAPRAVLILTSLVLGLALHDGRAQVYYGPIPKHLEIAPVAGYMVNTEVQVSDGIIEVDNGPAYGATIGLDVRKGGQIELLYVFNKADARYLSDLDSSKNFNFNAVSMYFMLGYTFEMRPLKMSTPFFSAGLGGWWSQPQGTTYQDKWLVAMHFGGGYKFYFSEVIGVRLQAHALLPLVFSGGGLYVGTGGSGLAVGAGIPIAQFFFSGGLIFAL
jgi:hypothetical protein